MFEARRKQLVHLFDWYETNYPRLQRGALFSGWLWQIIVTPMSLPLAIIFTIACLALAFIFPHFVNPLLDSVVEECVSAIVNALYFGGYVLWPLMLEYLPLILVILVERPLFVCPIFWAQVKLDIAISCDLCLSQVCGMEQAQQRGRQVTFRSLPGIRQYSIAKVPYRLYPLSCILLE